MLEGAPPALFKRKLFVERSRVLARRGHPAIRRGKLSVDDYLASSHLLIAPRGTPGGPLDTRLAALGHARQVTVRVPYFDVAPRLVATSDLLLTAGERLLARATEEHAVESHPLPFELPPYTVSLVWHARSQDDPAQAWLRERVVAAHARAYA
jgi:DNA-binding transcriptional LysR family regulator